ncbi:MAG: penicillin-binding protein 1A [Cyanobacteria bacterium P01_D01_bin.73]
MHWWTIVQNAGRVTGGTLLTATLVGSATLAGGLVGLAFSFRNLPDVRVLQDYSPSETSYIYDIKGKLLSSLHDEANREVVAFENISPHLKRAVLAIEDSAFYDHPGVNVGSVLRASVVNLESGQTREGGSTITMQLVKNLFLSPQKKISRKVAEAVLSFRLEQIFTKDEILEMYLNQVYWGHNNYGIQTAARSYFNSTAGELSLAESAFLAGLIQAPEDYSPFNNNYPLAKKRQIQVLARMQQLGWITPEEMETAKAEPLWIAENTSFQTSKLPYITNAAIQELEKRFGRDRLLRGGIRVQLTVDSAYQRMAENTVKESFARMRRQGARIDQIALVAVDPRTHFVKALVGGVDFKKSQFNRAVQALRQPGSSFKPFVYYAAFASGKYTPNSIVQDTPVSYPDGNRRYRPKNYGGGYSGSVSIQRAIEVSLNIPAVRLGQEVGLNRVIEIARVLGFHSPLEPVISLPLGSEDVTPLEMAGAFATFASGGWHSDTTLIVQVTDSSGKQLLDNTPKPRLVLDPWAVASLNQTLKGVIQQGTAQTAKLGRPAAGKTGTTDAERDVWFVGYVPQLSVAVWAGNDNYSRIGRGATGGNYVAPVWRSFMQRALKGVPPQDFAPPSNFSKPTGF